MRENSMSNQSSADRNSNEGSSQSRIPESGSQLTNSSEKEEFESQKHHPFLSPVLLDQFQFQSIFGPYNPQNF